MQRDHHFCEDNVSLSCRPTHRGRSESMMTRSLSRAGTWPRPASDMALVVLFCLLLLGACADPFEGLQSAAGTFEMPESFVTIGEPDSSGENTRGGPVVGIELRTSLTPDDACLQARAALESWTSAEVVVVERSFSTEYCIIGTWAPTEHDGVEFARFHIYKSRFESDSVSTMNLVFYESAPYDRPAAPTPFPTPSEVFSYRARLQTSGDLASVRFADRLAFDEYVAQLKDEGESGLVECMQLHGLDYARQHFVGSNGHLPTTIDREAVAIQGFGIATPAITSIPVVQRSDHIVRNFAIQSALTATEYDRYQRLFGVARESGCVREARADVDRLSSVIDALRTELLAVQTSFENDDRILELDLEWASCMTLSGYDFAFREAAMVSIRQQLGEIVRAAEPDVAENATTGALLPLTQEGQDALEVLVEAERELAIASFDCEKETQVERLAVEAEYSEQFLAQNGSAIDEILGSF